MGTLGTLYKFRSSLIVILAPILLTPIIIFSPQELYTEVACAYTILLMAVYWVTEVVPLAVTALLPLVFYPFLGILPARVVSVQYLKDVNVLFLGGLTVAVAVEHWNLHKRIALKVLTLVGAKPRWLLFGFMVTTAFLSMWISNVATTAMMIPIAQAVLSELNIGAESGKESDSSSADSGRSTPKDEEVGIVNPQQSHTHSKEINPLVAEMGNIGQAQELASRLTGSGSENAVVSYSNRQMNQHYSGPPNYTSLATDDGYATTTGNDQIEIQITMPDTPTPLASPKHKHSPLNLSVKRNDDEASEAPDCSTTQLIKPGNGGFGIDIGDRIDREKRTAGMAKALTICVCYAANIGGTATLTGTGPNLIMAGQFKTTYPHAPEVDFGSWAFFSFPGMLIFLLLSWLWIEYLFLCTNWRDMFACFKKDYQKSFEEKQAEDIIKRQYKELGPMSFAETSVLTLFILLALLWLTRDPGFVKGWGSLPIFRSRYVSDASVAMLITFILFIFPSKRPNFFCCRARYDSSESGPVPPLLTWNIVHQKMAWNVILLLGGGFAMALGSKESGLSKWIGMQMTPLNALSPFTANLICCLVICALTQCTSNTATATVFLPILAELAEVLHVNPLYLMLPSTVITSYAFMLPVSTPPNAIAYSYGHLSMKDMIKAGFILNIVGVFMALFSLSAFGGPAFQVYDACPDWLRSEYCSNLTSTISPFPLNQTLLTPISNVTALT